MTETRVPELGRRGEGWVVAQFVLLAAIALSALVGLGSWLALIVAGAVVMALGAVLVVLGSVQLGSALTPFPRPRAGGELVGGGLYAQVRHPIYGGAILLGAGWSLVFASIVGGVLTLALAVLFDLKSRREEAWLVDHYADYRAYRARVRRRFVPYLY